MSKLFEYRYSYKCSNCGKQVDWRAESCIYCGHDRILCPNCKNSLEYNQTICNKCGFILEGSPLGKNERIYKFFEFMKKNDKKITKYLLLCFVICILTFMIVITNAP